MIPTPLRVGYVLFVDESGDDGYAKVWPIDPRGASEWLVLGAVLVRVANQASPVQWVREFKRTIKGAQSPDLHYYTLSAEKRLEACEHLAQCPVRCFAVISNKRNMRGYRNYRAERWDTRNPLYNWLLRVLLEKASRYCAGRSMYDYGEMRSMRIELGARGGVSVPRIRVYLQKLRAQSQMKWLVVKRDDLAWECIDEMQIEAIRADKRAGIQLADTVASAFGNAVSLRGGPMDPRPAKGLFKVMAQRKKGWRAGFSVKLLPDPPALWRAGLTADHVAFFESFDYERGFLASPDTQIG